MRVDEMTEQAVERKDPLGDRMKQRYEDRTRYYLPRRSYTILRLDGRAFHTYTHGMERPYDTGFMAAMDATALRMAPKVMGAQFAYVQSDEISILLTDFEKPTTEAWFDGNIQKICSVSAGMATAFFNAEAAYLGAGRLAHFDARVFTIPDPVETQNYFVWRQQDATRNSIQMLAQHYYSQRELHGRNTAALQDMIHAKGDNWNNHPARFKRGSLVLYGAGAAYPDWRPERECPIFTADDGKALLRSLIPRQWPEESQ